jgi:hypothetical protein
MNTIVPKFGPYYGKDGGRGFCWLADGTYTNYARLVMMNFLHCKLIPKCFHVHHINENIQDDRIENLQLLSISQHISLHKPRDYKYGISKSDDANEYEKLRAKLDPNFKAKRKIIDKKHREKVDNDPVKKALQKKNRHEYWLKIREEPGFFEKLKIKNAYYRKLRKERKENAIT